MSELMKNLESAVLLKESLEAALGYRSDIYVRRGGGVVVRLYLYTADVHHQVAEIKRYIKKDLVRYRTSSKNCAGYLAIFDGFEFRIATDSPFCDGATLVTELKPRTFRHYVCPTEAEA